MREPGGCVSNWEKEREEGQGALGRGSRRFRGERLALLRPWQWDGEEVKVGASATGLWA